MTQNSEEAFARLDETLRKALAQLADLRMHIGVDDLERDLPDES